MKKLLFIIPFFIAAISIAMNKSNVATGSDYYEDSEDVYTETPDTTKKKKGLKGKLKKLIKSGKETLIEEEGSGEGGSGQTKLTVNEEGVEEEESKENSEVEKK